MDWCSVEAERQLSEKLTRAETSEDLIVGHCVSFFTRSCEGLWGVWYVLSKASQVIWRAFSGPISVSMHLRSLTIWRGSASVLASNSFIFCVGVSCRFSISLARALFHGAYSRISIPLNLDVVSFSNFLNAFSWCRRVVTCCSVDGTGEYNGVCCT